MNGLNRRQWLAAACAAASPLRAGNRIDRSRLSAITDEIAATPEDAIAFAKQYGLQWLELRSTPGSRGRPDGMEYFVLPPDKLKEAARQFSGNGIRISFLNTSMLKYYLPGTEPVNLRARRDPARFERSHDELQQALAAADILGCSLIRVFTFSRVQDPPALYPRVAEILGELAEAASKAGKQLLIENENACNVASCSELAALLKLIPSAAIGINWDPFNAENSRAEVAFPDGYKLLPARRIGNVQIKGRSVLPGPQQMDWAAIFRTLEKDGYQGCAGLETHIFGPELIRHSHDSMRELLRMVEQS